ncbi:hypothetical protein P9112_000311 [Eukaryota sp. TZLM1-RC]
MVSSFTIIVADKYAPSVAENLKQAGHNVIVDPSLKETSLTEALSQHQADILMVRSTKVQQEQLDASQNLKLVLRGGAGYDTINCQYAKEKGVRVCNTPGTNSVAVAEVAMGLVLSLDRFIPDNVIQARQGKWNKAQFSKAKGLKGQTIGLVGFGNIGKEVATRAAAFGMNVLVWSRSLTPELAQKHGVDFAASPMEVAERSDIVSIHCANAPETKGLCNAEFFSKMKEGAYFINTARAAVVVEQDLIDAMNNRGIRAGIDVPANEPSTGSCDFESELTKHQNAYVTHHIGASTSQASNAVGELACKVVDTFAREGEYIHCVNA